MDYLVGQLVRVSAAITDASGSAVDPSTLTMKYRTPGGTTTTLTYGTDAALVKDSVGNYHVDLSVQEAGAYQYVWTSTGTGQAIGEGAFVSRNTAI